MKVYIVYDIEEFGIITYINKVYTYEASAINYVKDHEGTDYLERELEE